MRFRNRLLLYIIPIILLTVFLVTALVVYTSGVNIKSLQDEIIEYRLEVVHEYIKTEYNTLERVNLQDTLLYATQSKTRAFDFINQTELRGGRFVIIDSNNTVIFHSGQTEVSVPSTTSQFLKDNLDSNRKIQSSSDGHVLLTYYEYFEPWDWYILAVVDRDIIYQDVYRAIWLSVGAGLVVLIGSIIIIRRIALMISQPIEDLTMGTLAMKNGQYDVRVETSGGGELSELAKSFNTMAEEIEDNFIQIRSKSESLSLLASFAAGMAHDLKTPIGNSNTLISYLDEEVKKFNEAYQNNQLRKGKFEAFIREMEESIDIMSKNIAQATELVTGYKTVSVDQLNRERRMIDLRSYVNEVLHTLRPKLKTSNITINNNVDDNVITWTYPGAISQILTNLIMNSQIHGFESMEAGQIDISIKKEGGNIVMVYEDNGVGISQENLKKLYDAFFTTKHDKGGSGLGMHIIYNLVKSLLHGRVECESQLGHGVRFTIVFPDEAQNS